MSDLVVNKRKKDQLVGNSQGEINARLRRKPSGSSETPASVGSSTQAQTHRDESRKAVRKVWVRDDLL